MSGLNYKNPISPIFSVGTQTVPRNETFGITYSVLNIGGYMEVYNLSDLVYDFIDRWSHKKFGQHNSN